MIVKQVGQLGMVNSRRGQELELRYGVRSRTYFSPFNHFFLHTLNPEALKNFSFVTARDGREQLRQLFHFRPGLFITTTKFAFHHQLIREIPDELQRRSFYYRFTGLKEDHSPRSNLLVIGKEAPDTDHHKTYFFGKDLLLEEIYQQKLPFHKFDFCYGLEIEDDISDCFLQYMLLRFGARRIGEKKSDENFRVVKKHALSFRHALEILKPI